MTLWMLATLALLPAMAVPVVHACRGRHGDAPGCGAARHGRHDALALCLALLTLPGTLLMSLFLERWL